MTILLYNSTAELNVLNKSGNLTLVTTLTGTLREGCNVRDPQILVELNSIPNFNYAYIPELSRYYFVRDIDNVNNKLWILKLHVDVLMTYRTQILQLKAEVDRNEYNFDLLLTDANRVNDITYGVEILEFEGSAHQLKIPQSQSDLNNSQHLVLYSLN